MEKSLKHGRCLDCPKGRPGILSRIIHGGDHLDLDCPGPETLLMPQGLKRIEQTGKLVLGAVEVEVCSKKITPQMREESDLNRQRQVDHNGELVTNSGIASVNAADTEQQVALDEPVTLIV